METVQARVKLTVRGRNLICQRRDQYSNACGQKYAWTIRKRSALPRLVFFIIVGFLRNCINRKMGEDIHTLRKASLRALMQAGEACGCHPELAADAGDVVWYRKGQPVIAFQVHEGAINPKRVAYLLRSSALLRFTIELHENGYFKLHRERTNSDTAA